MEVRARCLDFRVQSPAQHVEVLLCGVDPLQVDPQLAALDGLEDFRGIDPIRVYRLVVTVPVLRVDAGLEYP